MASPKEKVPTPAAPSPLGLLADELGEIDRALAPHRTRIARETALKSQLRDAADTPPKDAAREIRVFGERFDVILGPRALVRSISFRALVKLIGAVRFAKFATCTLSALEEHAPGMETSVVTGANTGPRSLKIFERAA